MVLTCFAKGNASAGSAHTAWHKTEWAHIPDNDGLLTYAGETVFSWLFRAPIFSWKRGNIIIPWDSWTWADFTTRSKFFQNKIPQNIQWQQGVHLCTAVAGCGSVFHGDFQPAQYYKPRHGSLRYPLVSRLLLWHKLFSKTSALHGIRVLYFMHQNPAGWAEDIWRSF